MRHRRGDGVWQDVRDERFTQGRFSSKNGNAATIGVVYDRRAIGDDGRERAMMETYEVVRGGPEDKRTRHSCRPGRVTRN